MPADSANRITPALAWSLTIGGTLCLAAGGLVLWKGQQPILPRLFLPFAALSLLAMGLGSLLEPAHPRLSTRLKFAAKVAIGGALFCFSWGLSHP